jgi:hypothetical protein
MWSPILLVVYYCMLQFKGAFFFFPLSLSVMWFQCFRCQHRRSVHCVVNPAMHGHYCYYLIMHHHRHSLSPSQILLFHSSFIIIIAWVSSYLPHVATVSYNFSTIIIVFVQSLYSCSLRISNDLTSCLVCGISGSVDGSGTVW